MTRSALLLAVVLSAPALRAAEPWADPKLPVRDGLELWLDATRVGPKPVTGPLDAWHDGSGNGRHVRQSEAAARPIVVPYAGCAVVRFDGVDDHLWAAKPAAEVKAFTVFVVAAPRANPGGFRGLLSFNAVGQRDYQSGLNIDLGSRGTPRFTELNVEGRGFGGARNLLKPGGPFARLYALEVRGEPKAVRVFVDGAFSGERPRDGSPVSLDEITIGSRHPTPDKGPGQARGFLRADIAEVLVYGRALSDGESKAVRGYLDAKYAGLRTELPPDGDGRGEPLVPVADPPPVQVFVPGFTVRQLPVDLPNVNNVKYRPDGTLVALAYNGDVWHLRDTDGDGLEDKADRFWENKGRLRAPIGMDLTPPGYARGDGLFVASKGKVSLIVDTDKDGKADKEIVVAGGWAEIKNNVDALAVAYDPRDGGVYYGRLTADYTNAYLIDKEGKAKYSLTDEPSTIIRVTPDFKTREIVATGIRVPVALRFNRHGDLFCTDQEGATWLPNGNPFDELLHIQKGRHYGFPPRHPKHLPGVIDEPSTFDYAPQHQSTCGLNFNEPVNGGPVFGPDGWRSDALVAGYSRGKVYRTALVKTPAGYVARNHLFANLATLASDVCVSPRGELVVAAHSGGPDWGSGPTGKGKLYKVAYTGRDLPQPVLVWPQTPREIRVAFDRPLAPAHVAGILAGTGVEYGRYVAAGDRFESLWPGYKVVQDQLRAPRYDLPVHAAQVTPDGRTLILSTAAHPEAVSYALTLPGLGRPAMPDAKRGELAQVAATDLQYDLTGVEAAWRPKAGDASWSGWLPHLDLGVARSFTRESADHESFWARCRQPGELTLRAALDLRDMLRPAVQPDAKIDYEWLAEKVTLTFRSRSAFAVKAGSGATTARRDGDNGFTATISAGAEARVPVEVVLPTGDGDPDLSVTWHTAEDSRPRPLPLRRLLLPWAPTARAEATAEAPEVPELKGGNWTRGRAVFLSEQAACGKCHAVRGEGGGIGPDLSNLPHRDYHSVFRDVAEPSFAINPDYVTQVVTLSDGRVLTGSVRTEGDRLLVGDDKGRVTVVPRGDVEAVKPAKASVMPEGLPKLLGPEKTRDLLTFLLTDPPRMPDYGRGKPPEPRSRKEVAAILAGAPSPPERTRNLNVVLVAGRKDHGPGEHDYPAWQAAWRRLLMMADGTTVGVADAWPTPDQLRTADVLVFYQQGTWTPERAKDLDAFLARGGGAVYVHYAVDGGKDAPGFAQRIGLAWQGGKSKFRHGPLDLGFETGTRHPVGRNFDKVHFHDESYWQLVGDPKRVTLLATGKEDGQDQPLFWTLEPGRGRVFVSIPGHFSWTFDDPLFRVLLLRGIAWAGKEPVDRFNDLVTPGARLKD